MSLSLLEGHSLEALKVAEGLTGLASGELLSPRGGGPLGEDAISGQDLLYDTSAGTALNLASKVGQRDPAEGHLLSLDASGGAINDHSLAVNDVDDGDHLAGLGTVVHERMTSRLHETLELNHRNGTEMG